MNNEQAMQIYDLLIQAGTKGMTVTEVAEATQLPVAQVQAFLQSCDGVFEAVGNDQGQFAVQPTMIDRTAAAKAIEKHTQSKGGGVFWSLIWFTLIISLVTVFISTQPS